MSTRTACPNCNANLKVGIDRVGALVRCPACQNKFTVGSVAFAEGATVDGSHTALNTHDGNGDSAVSAASETNDGNRTPPATIGKLGRFEIRKVLGSGGFGVVYLAHDPVLNRPVALKVPKFSASQTKRVRRFLGEAKTAAKLRHPHIVAVYESGQEGGKYFIASEYVDGSTLAQVIKERRPDFRQSAEWVRLLAEAFAYAHQEGIVHRDIKPENVMIDTQKRPQIMDFGLAKQLDDDSSMTAEGSLLGTPAYMSPEQARGDHAQVGPASDQYSLGVVLYELLTGQKPFDGPPHTVISKVAGEEPPAPRTINPESPRDLEAICQKAMEKNIGRRYADCQAFASDLHRWSRGEPTLSRPIGRIERLVRWCRRNPLLAGLNGAVAALLLAVAIVSSIAAVRLDREKGRADKKAEEALEQKRAALLQKQLADEQTVEAQRERSLAKQESRRAYHQTYLATMLLAQRDLNADDVDHLLERLEQTRPGQTGGDDLRGFEWYYWNNLCHGDMHRIRGHSAGVTSVAFCADGRRIVSGSFDKCVKVWDATTWEVILTLSEQLGRVTCVAFSPDGRRISGCDATLIKVWDASTGQKICTIRHAATSVAFSPDGRRIASGNGIWDASTGKNLVSIQSDDRNIAFSPDGRRIASGGQTKATVRDATTGDPVFELVSPGRYFSSVAFSPDGRRIVSVANSNSTAAPCEITVWDASTGREILTTKQQGTSTSVAFSPDGRKIVSGHNREVTLRDATTGKLILAPMLHDKGVSSVAFSPDGRRIVSALSSGLSEGTIKIWDATTGKTVFTVTRQERRLGSDSDARVWNGAPGLGKAAGQTMIKLQKFPAAAKVNPTDSLAFNVHGTRIVKVDGEPGYITSWNTATGETELLPVVVPARETHTRVTSVAYSPDGGRIVTGSSDKTLIVWDARTGQNLHALPLKDGIGYIASVAYSPDGAQIVAGFNGFLRGVIRASYLCLWDAATGKELRTVNLSHNSIGCVSFSPDGKRIVAGGSAEEVVVCDLTTGQESLTLQGHTGGVFCVGFSPNGQWIATGGAGAKGKIWDATTGEVSCTLTGLNSFINSMAFSPDGTRIVSGSHDGDVRVWDVTTGQEILVLNPPNGNSRAVMFTPDGRRILSIDRDGTLTAWIAEPKEGSPAP